MIPTTLFIISECLYIVPLRYKSYSTNYYVKKYQIRGLGKHNQIFYVFLPGRVLFKFQKMPDSNQGEYE